MELENQNPTVFGKAKLRDILPQEEDDEVLDVIDDREVFDLLRDINDPEHPLTLEELNVLQLENIQVDNEENYVSVLITPTIPHCSMATLIGLSVRVKLWRSLPPRFKVDVRITPGSHTSELAINKQLADKERVAAALENVQLARMVNQCLAPRDR